MELISREMALDHMRVLGGEDRERLMGILNNKNILPTIESRPKAKWIVDRYCSSCEWDKHDFDYIGGWRENYCPCCGADMRGE